MRMFTPGEPMPAITDATGQQQLTFAALPYAVEQRDAPNQALAHEMIARGNEFPLISNFELYVAVAKRLSADMPQEVSVHFIDKTTNQRFAEWDMFESGDKIPLPEKGRLVSRMDEDYSFVATADDQYMYIAEGGSKLPLIYTCYAKVPKETYIAEWHKFSSR